MEFGDLDWGDLGLIDLADDNEKCLMFWIAVQALWVT